MKLVTNATVIEPQGKANLSRLRRIVRDSTHEELYFKLGLTDLVLMRMKGVPRPSRWKKVDVDLTTASRLLSVYDALKKAKNKAKFESMLECPARFVKLVNICWRA